MHKPEPTVLMLIDVQTRLWPVMHEPERLESNLIRLLEGAAVLRLPIIWLEQVPAKLGPTLPSLTERLAGHSPIVKQSFSALGEDACRARLAELAPARVVLAGIEAHVCVWQTARDLLSLGLEVLLLQDCVSSRQPFDCRVALERMQQLGVQAATVEMLFFEQLQNAMHPAFRDIQRLIR